MYFVNNLISYHESLRQDKFKPIRDEISKLLNAFNEQQNKQQLTKKILDDTIQYLFDYFIQNKDYIALYSDNSSKVLRLLHNLQLANYIVENKHLFNDRNLYEMVTVALLHNLPIYQINKCLDLIVFKYCQRFQDSFKARLLNDKNLANATEQQINMLYEKKNKENNDLFPGNVRQIFFILSMFKKYKEDDCPIIANYEYDEFLKARFIYNKHENNKDFVMLLLFDAMVSAKNLGDQEIHSEVMVYDVLRFISLIFSGEYKLGTANEIKFSKEITGELRRRTVALRKANPRYKKILELIKNKLQVDYFDLFDLSKDFLNEQLMMAYDKAIEQKLIDEEAISYVEDRIKDIEKIIKNLKEGKNIKDLVAFRIICRSMEDAWRVKKLFDQLLGLKENKTRFKDFNKNPKENGYSDVLHCTYENVLGIKDKEGNVLKKVPIEIQFVGGEEAHVNNQRGETTDHTTYYSHGYKKIELKENFIFIESENATRVFGRKGFFYKLSKEQRVLDVICELISTAQNGLPKKLDVYIKNHGKLNKLGNSSIIYNYNYQLQPGDILVFKQEANIDKEIVDNYWLVEHRKMIDKLSRKRSTPINLALEIIQSTEMTDTYKFNIPPASNYATLIKYLSDTKEIKLPNRFRIQERSPGTFKYRDVKDIRQIPDIDAKILITHRKKGENHANFNIKDFSFLKELDKYCDPEILQKIKEMLAGQNKDNLLN
jgi:ribosomal protein L17